MLLGELQTGFSWGVLLVTDEESADKIPRWTSADEQVTHSATAAAIRVMHQDEGNVTVQVWNSRSVVRGALAFAGSLDLASGVLVVSDALGASTLRVPVGAGSTILEIYTDSPVEATHVDLVVTRATVRELSGS